MATRRNRPSFRRATKRSPMRRTRRGGRPWTSQELSFLRKYYRNNETSWVARQLGRTVYSVRYKASDLSIRKANPSVWRGNTGTTRTTTRRKTTRRPTSRRATQTRRRTTRTRWGRSTRRTARRSTSRRRTRSRR